MKFKPHVRADGMSVETWWDRRSRNWVTTIRDKDRNQIGDADFGGCEDTAKSNHASAIARLNADRIRDDGRKP